MTEYIQEMKSQLEKIPTRKRKARKEQTLRIQGAEAMRDIYTTFSVNDGSSSGEYCVNKNNYPTYSKMVQAGYEMYKNSPKYGGEFYGALMTSRVSFIGGEGPTATSDDPKVQEWANNWLEINGLTGTRNIRFMEAGELEGKFLMLLKETKEPPAYLNEGKPFVSVQGLHWYHQNYKVEKDPNNSDIIKKISYKKKGEDGEEKKIDTDRAVFVQLGGLDNDTDETVYGLMRCLTEIESASRIYFDINHTSSLYGFPKPSIKVPPGPSAVNEVNNTKKAFENKKVPPWLMYIGTGEFKYATPGAQGMAPLIEALKTTLRIISFNSDMPMLMIVWPEMMSNRATADSIVDIVNNKTAIPRTIWETSYKEAIYKARIMSADNGWIPDGLTQEEFTSPEIKIKMPLASFEILKQILNVWLPLFEKGIIGKDTLRNMTPGVDPADELKQEEKARKKQEKINEQRRENEIPGNENPGINPGAKNDDRRNQPPGNTGDE